MSVLSRFSLKSRFLSILFLVLLLSSITSQAYTASKLSTHPDLQAIIQQNPALANELDKIGAIQTTPFCMVNLLTNTTIGCPAIYFNFSVPPSGGKAVLRTNLQPTGGSRYGRIIYLVDYGATTSGWTVNIGDSGTNNGYGGDGGAQSNDAETQILNGTMSVYANQTGGSALLQTVPSFSLSNYLVRLEVADEQLVWDNYHGSNSSLTNTNLYALCGQPDSEGPINYNVFSGFNRSIGMSSRTGTGVQWAIVLLTGDPCIP